MARTLVAIDGRIVTLQQRLAELRADFQLQQGRLQAELDRLRAVRLQITPEIEAVLVSLDQATER